MTLRDSFETDLLAAVDDWYEAERHKSGKVNGNVMTAGLFVTHHLRSGLPLREADFLSKKESQLALIGGPATAKILAAHGESRPFLKEGGRTSRGTIILARRLIDILNSSERIDAWAELGADDQRMLADSLELWFVERIRADYFGRQAIKVKEIDPSRPVQVAVGTLLTAARASGGNAAGAFAQHLVGTKLQLRFPMIAVNRESYTTADDQTQRPGDFLVGTTAIHVTVRPTEALFARRCESNLQDGYRPLVIVPRDMIPTAEGLASIHGLAGRVAIQSLETFVGTNIDEMAEFDGDAITSGLHTLLVAYNDRVSDIEPDPSLRIEIPRALARRFESREQEVDSE